MLSPPGPAQKNFNEEDSSDSDAGSEVSLEPKTDRFGFIVTNGSTARSVGPHPQLVRQREAKWISIMNQWEGILLKKTNKVKVQCQKGIPASLRGKCWPLLCGATDKMKQNQHLYEFLDSKPALQSWVDVIERDLDRQFPFHEMFLSKDGHGQRGLFRVLKAYTQYQPEEGYCQAQGPVAAVLLMNMPAEEAFWCLVQISEQYLPGYYSPLLEGVLFDAGMLTWLLKRTCPSAHKHLQHHGVEPLMFATDWLMCLFIRHLPFNTLLRVWDLFFCYGVRVLLQVAVVLVRRVLGRAEQRKQCQGQMETLERLRGIRDEVQEEDDAFISEVCSVPLSARDLERQTEKALEKWRKERPSSTFDPRGRCQGYQMASERAKHIKEERDKKEREKGNLSVPLARSASTLSLSPSLLHKRWKKGTKASTRELPGGVGIMRRLSMGAKEDRESWDESNFKRVQSVKEEDVAREEHKTQSEPKRAGQTKQRELLEESQNTVTPHPETRGEATVRSNAEETGSQQSESEQGRCLSQNVESTEDDTIVKTHLSQSAAEAPFAKDIPLPAEQAEESDTHSQSQVVRQQSHQEHDAKSTTEETEQQVADREQCVSEVQTQEDAEADVKTEAETKVGVNAREETADTKSEETERAPQQTRVGKVADVIIIIEPELHTSVELSPEVEEDKYTEDHRVKNQDSNLETQQQQQQQQTDVITEPGNSSQEAVFEVQHHSAKSLSEADITKECHPQTETETDTRAQSQEEAEGNAAMQDPSAADAQADGERDTLPLKEATAETINPTSLERLQQRGAVVTAADSGTDAATPVADDTATLTSEECSRCSEEESETEAPEPRKAEEMSASHAEAQVDNDSTLRDQIQAEAPREAQANFETTIATATPGETSSQPEANLTAAEPDGTTSLDEQCALEQPDSQATAEEKRSSDVEGSTAGEGPSQPVVNLTAAEHDGRTSSAEQCAPGQPESQATAEEKMSTGVVQEGAGGEGEVFFSPEPKENPNTDSSKVQNKGDAKDPAEASPSSLALASECDGRHLPGDVCVRKSSSSRGSRLARRLSEDLFTIPQKTNQSNPTLPHHVKNTDSPFNPGASNKTPAASDGTEITSSLCSEAAARTALQQEPGPPNPPKHFSLFRRLKGEQPKKAKGKGAPKMQVPKILIQDFSDVVGAGKVEEEEEEVEKLSSRERRRKRRERERKEKEEERLRRKREKELRKEMEPERRKPQTRGQSFQVQRERGSAGANQGAKTGSKATQYSASYAEAYF